MVNLLVLNPTDNPLPTGSPLAAPISLGVIAPFNPTIGSGKLTAFTSTSAAANGSYSIDVIVSGSGNFNVSVNADTTDANWQVSIGLTGTFEPYGVSFPASAAQFGNSIVFTNLNNPQQTVTMTQDNGDLVTSGKITINLSTAPVTLYIMNA